MSVYAVVKRSDTMTVDGSSKGKAKINLRGGSLKGPKFYAYH